MRRLLLPALLALTLTACSVPSVTQIQNAPLPPTAMLESAEEPIQYTVELQTWEQSSRAEDGTPLVSCTYTLPVLAASRGDGTAVDEAPRRSRRSGPWRSRRPSTGSFRPGPRGRRLTS